MFIAYVLILFCSLCCFLYQEEPYAKTIHQLSDSSVTDRYWTDSDFALSPSTPSVFEVNDQSVIHTNGTSRTDESTDLSAANSGGLAAMTIRELKKLASESHVRGYSNLRKTELIEALLRI